MDRIEVTDEMRSRILRNLQKADWEPAPRQKVILFSSVKKYLSLAACFAILLFGALTLSNLNKNAVPNGPETVFHSSGIVEVSSAEALSAALGYMEIMPA